MIIYIRCIRLYINNINILVYFNLNLFIYQFKIFNIYYKLLFY